MDKNHFNKEIHSFKKQSLPEDRKNLIKSELVRYANNTPKQAGVRQSLTKKVSAIGLGLALLFGGTAYAAEQSLPGDLLYPVKVSIVEPLIKATKLSVEAKAEYDARLVNKRVSEQQKIVERGGGPGEQTTTDEDSMTTPALTEVEEVEKSASLKLEIDVGANTSVTTTTPFDKTIDQIQELEINTNVSSEEDLLIETGVELLPKPPEQAPLPTPPLPVTNSPQISL